MNILATNIVYSKLKVRRFKMPNAAYSNRCGALGYVQHTSFTKFKKHRLHFLCFGTASSFLVYLHRQ